MKYIFIPAWSVIKFLCRVIWVVISISITVITLVLVFIWTFSFKSVRDYYMWTREVDSTDYGFADNYCSDKHMLEDTAGDPYTIKIWDTYWDYIINNYRTKTYYPTKQEEHEKPTKPNFPSDR